MAALLALSAPPASDLVNPRVDYGGLPRLVAKNVVYESHRAEFTVGRSVVAVRTTSVFRTSPQGGFGRPLLVALRHRLADPRAPKPMFPVDATWDDQPLSLRVTSLAENTRDSYRRTSLEVEPPLKADRRHTLVLRYRVPSGRLGYDGVQKLAAYGLDDPGQPIENLQLVFRYSPDIVVGLPEMGPFEGWQVGDDAAFYRRLDFRPTGELVTMRYYAGQPNRDGSGLR